MLLTDSSVAHEAIASCGHSLERDIVILQRLEAFRNPLRGILLAALGRFILRESSRRSLSESLVLAVAALLSEALILTVVLSVILAASLSGLCASA